MATHEARRHWTYAEFARLPSETSTRYEVIDGVLAVTPSPSTGHQRIVIRLGALLHDFVRERGLGEVFVAPLDVLLGDGDYLEPDILFVSADRTHLLSDRGVEGPPDLVVEVVSPSTEERDRGVKLDRYRLHGVGAYWMVDGGSRSVEIWDLANDAARPQRVDPGSTLIWRPDPGHEALEISLVDLFGP